MPVGANGGSIVISGDSKWLGYIVSPPRVDSSARGRGAGRGGGTAGNTRGGGAGAPNVAGLAGDSTRRAPANKFVLMRLASREKTEFERIRGFQFNGETPTWVALTGYPPGASGSTGQAAAIGGRAGGPPTAAAGAVGGANVILYSLETGERFNLGSVGQFLTEMTMSDTPETALVFVRDDGGALQPDAQIERGHRMARLVDRG